MAGMKKRARKVTREDRNALREHARQMAIARKVMKEDRVALRALAQQHGLLDGDA